MKNHILIGLILLLGLNIISAQIPTSVSSEQILSHEEAIADIEYLVEMLNKTHPDPYRGFEGRVNFQFKALKMIEAVPENGISQTELYNLIRPFICSVKDGHTYVNRPGNIPNTRKKSYLPVRFKVADNAIFVNETKQNYKHLLGCRLLGVEDLNLDELRTIIGNIFPCENEHASSRRVIRYLQSHRSVYLIKEEIEHEVSLKLLNPDGQEIAVILPYSDSDSDWIPSKWSGTNWDKKSKYDHPFYSKVWPDKNAAYLRIETVMAREAFELMRANGRTDLNNFLKKFYEQYINRDMPSNLDSAIAGIPSITEITRQVLLEMKEEKVEHLIIDLRGNDGGWSAIAIPMYYMIAGDDYFGMPDPVLFATRMSDVYLDINGTTLIDFNKKNKSSLKLGDLLVNKTDEGLTPLEKRLKYLDKLEEKGVSFLKDIEDIDGVPIYSPEMYVISDPGTFSAAYDMLYQLWRLGAKVVGVAPAQAANSFVDGSQFTLPNSKLKGGISRTSVIYPGVPEKERTFVPDYSMKWEDFRKYNFDIESEVLYVLDHINNQ